MRNILTKTGFILFVVAAALLNTNRLFAQVIPPNISYGDNKTYLVGKPIIPVTPVNTGGPVTGGFSNKTPLDSATSITELAVDADNNYYYRAGRTIVAVVNGEHVTFTSASTIGAIAVSNSGDIYFTNNARKTLIKINASSGTQSTVLTGTNVISSLAIDNEDNIYITISKDGSIRKIAADDYEQSTLISGLTDLTNIATDNNGNLYVLIGGNTIEKISLADLSTSTIDVGYFVDILVADPLGNIYTRNADEFYGDIYKMSFADNTVTKLPGINADYIATGTGKFFTARFRSEDAVIESYDFTNYSISPQLPDGLAFDTGTGIISGTPTAASPAANYVITAYSDEIGTDTISIGVINNGLASLALTNATLQPGFDNTITTYSATVENNITSVKISPIANLPTAIIKVNDEVIAPGDSQNIHLNPGINLIKVGVVAPGDTDTLTYTLNITRSASSDATLSGLSLNTGELTPAFDPEMGVYTATVITDSISVTATVNEPHAALTINGVTVASASPSGKTYLEYGNNPITVTVTAQDSLTTKTYVINVTRKKSSDALLSGLSLSAGDLSPVFDPGLGEYTTEVTNATDSVSVTATANNHYAAINIEGNPVPSGNPSGKIALAYGDNPIIVMVTAEDGTTTANYTINITRKKLSDATLKDLSLSAGDLSPAFDPALSEYTATVANATDSISVTAWVNQPTATLSINGSTVAPGTASDNLPLIVGNNAIVVSVAAGDSTRTYNINITRLGSADASLGSLTLSGAELSPVFDPAVPAYTASVDNSTASVKVSAIINQPDAVFTINDSTAASGVESADIPLTVGDNTITILVTAQAGNTATYTITVNRAASSDNKLNGLSLNGATLLPDFNADTLTYTALVDHTVETISVQATVNQPDATLEVNETPVLSGETSADIPLTIGDNTLTVAVTAQNGAIKTYTINVKRAPVPDASLSSLAINDTELSPAFDADTLAYTASVINDVASVIVTASGNQAGAVITINDITVPSGAASPEIPLMVGDNSIVVKVTAYDGTDKTYTLTVNRAASADASLSSLAVAGVELSPDFNTAITDYTAVVGNEVATVDISAMVNQPDATISINGTTVKSGEALTGIPLTVGANSINAVVVAQDATTTTTYNININRAASADATLSNLTLSGVELSPAFSADSTSYAASVSNEVSTVDVSAIANQPDATISINGTTVKSGEALTGLPLNVGENAIVVTVVAQDSTTTITYNISITRAASADATLSALSAEGGTLTPDFDPATTTYSVAVPNNIATTHILATANQPDAVITINDNPALSGVLSGDIPLTIGDNIFNINVTSQDGSATNSYTLVITRSLSADSKLKSLQLNNGAISPDFDPATTSYTALVGSDVTSVNVAALANYPEASITVNRVDIEPGESSPDMAINAGNNNIIVKVTAQDGKSTTNYTIVVTRPVSTEASLGGLNLDGASLSPVFNGATESYTAVVPNNISSVTLTAIAKHPYAKINISDFIRTGLLSKIISLNVGSNTINISTTAEDGTTVLAYTLTITRGKPSNAALKALVVNTATISPVFAADTKAYTATVLNSTSSITIKPTAADALATIKVNNAAVASGAASASIPLMVGVNNITVDVTAQDGTINTYTIAVTRVGLTATLTYNTPVVVYTRTYDIVDIVPTLTNAGTLINYTASLPNGLRINPSTGVISGTPANTLPATNFTITANTSQGGVTTTINIAVADVDKINDVTLRDINTKETLTPEFNYKQRTYSITVPYYQTSITISPVLRHSNQDLELQIDNVVTKLTSTIPLKTNRTVLEYKVTTVGVKNAVYKVIVIRQTAPDPTLSTLSLSNVTLSPKFSGAVVNYTASVTGDVASTIVKYTTNEKPAVTVNGTAYTGTSAAIPLKLGSNTITIVVTDDDNVTKKTYTIVITKTKADQTIAFAQTKANLGDADFSPATASSGLAVTYASNNPKVITVVSNKLHIVSPGTAVITATQAGNSNYNAADESQTITIGKTPQTITFAAVTKKVGDTDFSPATASSKLVVTYASSNTAVVSVVNGKLHIVAPGTATITATQAGNSTYEAAPVVKQNVTVSKLAQTITFAAISKSVGDADFSPAKASSGLPVAYTSSNNAIATIVNGKIHAVSAGAVTITAGQPGNDSYAAAANLAQKVTITIGAQTITFAAVSKKFGDEDFSPATASSGLPVTYTSADSKIASIINGKIHIAATGTVTITAAQAGAKNQYTAAKSISQKIIISIGTQTITFAAQNKIYGDADFSPATTSSGLPITYTSNNTKVAGVVNGKVHIVAAGTVTITAAQPGIKNQYSAATSVSQKITISKASQAIAFNVQSKTYGDADFTAATATSGLPVSFTSSNTKVVSVVNNKLHITGAGAATITASQAGNSTQYDAAKTATLQLTIKKTTLTITADSKTKKAGAANPVLTATFTGFVNGDDKTDLLTQPVLSTTANTASKAGTYVISVSGAASNNYAFTYVAGKLVVSASTIKTTANDTPPPVVSRSLSPNGDGINDVLTIEGIGNYPDNKLVVMDAAGTNVYEKQGYDNLSNVFDGHSDKSRAMQKPGTYYYLLTYKDNGETKRITGFFIIKY